LTKEKRQSCAHAKTIKKTRANRIEPKPQQGKIMKIWGGTKVLNENPYGVWLIASGERRIQG